MRRAGLVALGLVALVGCTLLPHDHKVRELDWSGAGSRMFTEVQLDSGDYYMVWTTDNPGCQVSTLVRAGRRQGSNLIVATQNNDGTPTPDGRLLHIGQLDAGSYTFGFVAPCRWWVHLSAAEDPPSPTPAAVTTPIPIQTI